MDWSIARLSTGEKQRLGFRRAIEDEPDVLLIDEPTAALDEVSGRAVEAMIERLRCRGAAMIGVETLGLQFDLREVSPRALAVHKPREACMERGFAPAF